MTWAEYAAAWSRLHGGFDLDGASPVVRGWVRLAYRGGSLLARLGAGPGIVTAAGLALCVAVPLTVVFGPDGPSALLLGGVLVFASAAADGLDGAVAVVTGRASRLGFVLDSAADRLGEAAWLTALWLAGAPAWLVVTAGGVSWLHEYVRARAAAAGMAEIGVVTVGERPTRVSATVTALIIGGVAGLVHAGWDQAVVVIVTTAWLVLAVVGLGQLAVAVRRALAGPLP